MYLSECDLARLITPQKAAQLIKYLGGVDVYIPQKLDGGCPAASIVGMEAMTALCLEYGGQRVTLPSAGAEPKKGSIIKRLSHGQAPRDIALALKVTERWVRKVASDVRPVRQLSLFGG